MPRSRLTIILLLFAAVFLTFGSTLKNGFVYDDHSLIERNRVVRTLEPVPHLTSAYWSRWKIDTEYYRPVTTYSLAIDRAVFGDEPGGFHLVNLLLHAVAASLLYLLLRRIGGDLVAALAALFFAAHPLQAESVCWISGRTDLLAACFMLLAAVQYARMRDRARTSGFTDHLLLAFATALAVFSKETAVTLPVMLLSIDLAYSRAGGRDWSMAIRNAGRNFLRSGIVVVVVLAGYLAARAMLFGSVLGMDRSTGSALDNPLLGASWVERILTAVHVAGRYLGLTVYPAVLSADYGPDVIPKVASATSASFLLPMAALSIAVVVALLVARRDPAAVWGTATAAGAYLLVSNIIFVTPILMAERFLYIPMMGIAAVSASAIVSLGSLVGRGDRPRRPLVPVLIASCLLFPLAVRSFIRTADWRDDSTLFEATVRDAPRSVRGWTNIGAYQQKNGDLDGALVSFEKALEIRPDFDQPKWRMADIHRRRGDLESAERILRSAAAEHPGVPLITLNLVQVLNQRAADLVSKGKTAKGRDLSREVVEITRREMLSPSGDVSTQGGLVVMMLCSAESLARLGLVDQARVRYAEAIVALESQAGLDMSVDEAVGGIGVALYRSAASFDLAHGRTGPAADRLVMAASAAESAGQEEAARQLRITACETYMKANRPESALPLYDRLVLDVGEDEARVRHGRGRARLAVGDLDGAEEDLRLLLELELPSRIHAAAWTDLARISLRRNDRDEANTRLERALQIDPGFIDARRLQSALE